MEGGRLQPTEETALIEGGLKRKDSHMKKKMKKKQKKLKKILCYSDLLRAANLGAASKLLICGPSGNFSACPNNWAEAYCCLDVPSGYSAGMRA